MVSIYDSDLWNWDGDKASDYRRLRTHVSVTLTCQNLQALRYIEHLRQTAASAAQGNPGSTLAKDLKMVADSLKQYMCVSGYINTFPMRGFIVLLFRKERQVIRADSNGAMKYMRLRHLVGVEITIGDFYGALGMYSRTSREDSPDMHVLHFQ